MRITLDIDLNNLEGAADRLRGEALWIMKLADNLDGVTSALPVPMSTADVRAAFGQHAPAPTCEEKFPPDGLNDGGNGTPAAAPLPPTASEVDGRGVVWSPDFHASTKRRNADGSWQKKKGADAAALAAYESQFLSAPAAPAAPAAPPAPAPAAPAAPAAPSAPPAPAPAAPAAPAAPPAPSAPPKASLMMRISDAVARGVTTADAVLQIIAQYDCRTMADVVHKSEAEQATIAANLELMGAI